jgi:hypothetical protein
MTLDQPFEPHPEGGHFVAAVANRVVRAKSRTRRDPAEKIRAVPIGTTLAVFLRPSSGPTGIPPGYPRKRRRRTAYRDVRMGLQLAPELSLDRCDVDTDPAIVLTRISARRRFEVPTRRCCSVEDDVVLLARIPPQIVERRNLQVLVLSKPGVLGGVQRLVVLGGCRRSSGR